MFFGKEHQHNITNTKRGGRDESRPIHVLDMADQLSCWMDASQCESFIFYHHDSGCQESMIPMAPLVAEPTALRRSRLKTYEANTANQKNTKAEQTNNNNHEAPKEAFNPKAFLTGKIFFWVPCCAYLSIVAVKKVLETISQTVPRIAAPGVELPHEIQTIQHFFDPLLHSS